MKNISEKKYQEYLQLKIWAKREKVYQSLDSISSLENDIDLPIRKCVAMFALWGFEPLFSCCGFDYRGQPYHKSHQYGRPYFIFNYNDKSKWLIDCRFPNGWEAKTAQRKTKIFLELLAQGNPHWRKRECIHFSEECTLGIAWLEGWLLSNKLLFSDTVTLHDTNEKYKNNSVRYWQYEPKNPWIIEKQLIDSY